MDIKKIVGKKIQEYRKCCKLTQEQLAEIMNIETVSVSKIETGRSYPTSENLAKLSEILKVEPCEFFIQSEIKSDEELLKEIYMNIEFIKNNNNKKLSIVNNFIKTLI